MAIKSITLLFFLSLSSLAWSAPTGAPTWTNPKLAAQDRPDFLIQGEYASETHGLQIVSVEGERFYLSRYQGGLPGAGWNGSAIEHEWGNEETAREWARGFEKVMRTQLGNTEPPREALVLFDGSNGDEWKNAEVHDGLLLAGTSSKRKFKDFTLHFEFRTAFKPDIPLGHPDRGNSGLYIFGRYEVQIMDTFGLDLDRKIWEEAPLLTEPYAWCGSLYKFKTPDVNMCYPPLTWQSYDITFKAPRFKDGTKTESARITVHHNGVLIHDDIELPKGTGNGGKLPEIESGSLNLQKHGNLTYFRNIWIVED